MNLQLLALPRSASLETIKERGEEEDEERNISDLLLDGIEFAEVILLNKVSTRSTVDTKGGVVSNE